MNWRVSTLALTMFGLLIAWTWATSRDGVCSAAVFLNGLKELDPLNCAEFWLNRYQTLIGAVVAVGAAGFAYHGAILQASKAAEQVKIATSQAVFGYIDAIFKREKSIYGLYISIHEFHKSVVGLTTEVRNLQDSIEIIKTINTAEINDFISANNVNTDKFDRLNEFYRISNTNILKVIQDTLITSNITAVLNPYLAICTNRVNESLNAMQKIPNWLQDVRRGTVRATNYDLIVPLANENALLMLALEQESRRLEVLARKAIERSEKFDF